MSLLSRMGTGNGLPVSLIIAFVAVESIVAASFLSLLQFKTSTAEVSHRQQSLLELERMVGTVAGAETNQRGYLITGSEHYLAPYRDALNTLETHLRRIGVLTQDSLVQRRLVAQLENQIDRRSDEMNHAILARRTEGLPVAKSVVLVNHDHGTMNTIRQLAGQIRDEEVRALERHWADSQAWAVTAGSFTVVFFLVTAALFALCGVVLRLSLTSQAQAERLVQTTLPLAAD